eukprot:TRINITY_DN14677_c0_g1_i1.p1 TRINITY_DN14677_c0_g1~~TRINITY_DN14677_c0_g1_i1.p1  ORF type:complete len:263 (-),score=30.93 TRINITY_DN14677_c0_g1_i1:76-864(-)
MPGGAPPWRSPQASSANLAPPTFSHDSNAGTTSGPRLIPPPRLIAPPPHMLNWNAPPPNQMSSSARTGLVPAFAFLPSHANKEDQAATESPSSAPTELQQRFGTTSSVIRASQLHSRTSPGPKHSMAQTTPAEAPKTMSTSSDPAAWTPEPKAMPTAAPPLVAAPPAAKAMPTTAPPLPPSRPRPSTHTDSDMQDQSSWSEHPEGNEPTQASAWTSQTDTNGERDGSRASNNCTTTQVWDPATGEYIEEELPDDIKAMMSGI